VASGKFSIIVCTVYRLQSQTGHPDSTLELIRSLNKLRQDEGSLRYGAIHYLWNDTNVFSYVREHEGNDRLIICLFDIYFTTTFYKTIIMNVDK